MSGFESNGPGLQYKVSWRQKDGDDEWTSVVVANVSKYIVSGTPTFVPYLVKVQALNDVGFAPEPAVVMGHSGEDRKCLMLFREYFPPAKQNCQEFLLWLRGLRTQHSVCEDVGLIPCFTQWVKDLALPPDVV